MSLDISSSKVNKTLASLSAPTGSVISLDTKLSNTLLEFPPTELTANSTNITSASYANGTYIASASSTNGAFSPYLAFESTTTFQSADSFWSSTDPLYNATTGNYSGSVGTLAVNGTRYSGEWLQVQFPTAIKLSSFNIFPRQDSSNWTVNSPRDFVLLGSNNGSTWNLIYSTTTVNTWTTSSKTFSVSTSNSFRFFRLVTSRVGNDAGTTKTSVNISRLRFYGEPANKIAGTTLTGLSTFSPSSIVQNGLIAYFDPANPGSYPSTGGTMYSLIDGSTATLGGSYNYTAGNIRLNNTSGTASSNTSRLQLGSLSNITTVSIWMKQESTGATGGVHLLDMRTGGAGGFIWSGSPNAGSNWTTGTLYTNAGSAQAIRWSNIQNVGNWQNVTVIANTPATDDMTMFANYGANAGLDVTFGPILLYNRVLSAAENASNFNAIRSRYSLDGGVSSNTIERPLYYGSGGLSNGSYISLNSTNNRSLSSSTGSLNIATNGGLTITATAKAKSINRSSTDGVYPPAAMTADTTSITSASYGNGTYTALRSTSNGVNPYNAFDKNTSVAWSSAGGKYDTNGIYFGNNEVFPPAAMTSGSATFSGLSAANGTYTVSVSSTDVASAGFQAFDRNTNGSYWVSAPNVYNTAGSYIGSSSIWSTSGEWMYLTGPSGSYSPKSVTITCLDPSNAPSQLYVVHSTGLQTGILTAADWTINPSQTFNTGILSSTNYGGRNNWGIVVPNVSGTGGSLRIDEMSFTQIDPITTTDTMSTVHKGEYVQLQLPNSICPKSFTLTGGSGSVTSFALLGSANGSSWDLLYNTPLAVTLSTSGSTFLTNSPNLYNYFRLVCKSSSTNSSVRVYEISLTQSGVPSIPFSIFDGGDITNSNRVHFGQCATFIHPLDYISCAGIAPLVITETIGESYNGGGTPSLTWDRSQVSQTLSKTMVILRDATTIFGGPGTMLTYQFVVPFTTTYNVQLQTLPTNVSLNSLFCSLDGASAIIYDNNNGNAPLNFVIRTAYSSVTLTVGTHTLVIQARENGVLGGIIVQSTDGKYYGYSVNNKSLYSAIYNGSATYPQVTSMELPVTTPIAPSLSGSLGSPVVAFDARNLIGATVGNSISQLNNFVQNTVGNMPTYSTSSSFKDIPYMSFNRSSSQHFNGGSKTLNIATNGGFTALALVRFTGSVGSSERIFDFGIGQNNTNALFARNGTTGNVRFALLNSSTTYLLDSTTSPVVQNEWAVYGCRYNGSTRLAEIFKNGVQIASTTFGAAITDRTATTSYIGRSLWAADAYTNADIGFLYMYDKYLSDADLSTLYNTVTTVTYPKTLLTDRWQRYALTYNDSTGDVKTYIDNEVVQSDTAVNVYPPAAMTANTTTVSGATYGNGSYVTSTSSSSDNLRYTGFDKNSTTLYYLGGTRYDGSGNYFGNNEVFPPGVMTGNSTTFSGLATGNGTYTVSVSSTDVGSAGYFAFDSNTSTAWSSSIGVFDTSGTYVGSNSVYTIPGEFISLGIGAHPKSITITCNDPSKAPATLYIYHSTALYTGILTASDWTTNPTQTFNTGLSAATFWTGRFNWGIVITSLAGNGGQVQINEMSFAQTDPISTTDISNNVYKGEWAQLNIPVSISLKYFDVTMQGGSSSFTVLGSNDGNSWTTLYNTTQNITFVDSISQRFTVNSSTAYTQYRFVLKKATNASGAFRELQYYGTESITNKSLQRLNVGRSLFNGVAGSDLDIADIKVYDRVLSTQEMNSLSKLVTKPSSISSSIKAVKGRDTGVISLDARKLTFDNGSAIADWNGFTQSVDSQRPVYYSSGGYNNGPYVSFKKNTKSFLVGPLENMNISTNGGLTVAALVRFTGSATPNEPVFNMYGGSYGTATGNFVLARSGTDTNLQAISYNNVSSSDAANAVSTWTTRASAANNNWRSVVWSPELRLFIAVGDTGTGSRVMTSPDGITWVTRASAADNDWWSVAWSSQLGLFAAVSYTGTGNRVMTSPDGITWTTRASAADNQWTSIVWSPELALFVAVSNSGTGNRVMTSPDGITWTTRTSAADNSWRGITWSPQLRLFAASGIGSQVMTSPNGINWTTRASAGNLSWRGICWAQQLNLFVSVAEGAVGNGIMTSPDGITWTSRATPVDNNWYSVVWSAELSLLVAVSYNGAGNRVMTSPDGITWTTRASAADISWLSVTWAPELGVFTAVSQTGTGNRVMTSTNVYKGANVTSVNNTAYSNEWVPTALRYNASSGALQIYKNNAINTTTVASATLTDRLLTNVLIGKNSGEVYANMDLAALYVYDRYLSDSELTALYNDILGSGINKNNVTKIESGLKNTLTLSNAVVSVDSSNVSSRNVPLEFPPNNLITGNTTKITTAPYGNGTYICSASGFLVDANDFSAFKAFESNTLYTGTDSFWHSVASGNTIYNGATGNYVSTVTTLSTNGISYSGEWLGIQLPVGIKLSSFSIFPRQDSSWGTRRSPNNFVLLGGNDGSSWNLLYTGTNVNNWTQAAKSFNVSSSASFKFFRIVVSRVGNFNQTSLRDCVQISRLRLYGVPQDTSTLNYPPTELTANSTSITTADYGTGTYVASASSTSGSFAPFNAFGNSGLASGYKSYWSSTSNAFNATTGSFSNAAVTWTTRANDMACRSIVWAPELRLFVGISSVNNGVLTSTDGITWTTRSITGSTGSQSVTWAPELSLFVSVGYSTNNIRTSPDGITWTTRTNSLNSNWRSVAWSPQLRLFVAVTISGTGSGVITSPDGITWTSRTTPGDNGWFQVIWSPERSLFVAVGSTLAGTANNRFMTSPDGINWTLRGSPETSFYTCAWSAELSTFVALASNGILATSSDGISWTSRTSVVGNVWYGLIWAKELGLFVGVGGSGTGNRVITSPNGINWTTRSSAADNTWFSIAWAPEINTLAAVADTGTSLVMSSGGYNSGEWLVLQLPKTISLNSFSVTPIQDTTLCTRRSPRYFLMLGSTNGTSWTYLYGGSDVNNWSVASKSFAVSNTTSSKYNYYRLLTTRVGNSGATSNMDSLQIAGLTLYENAVPQTAPKIVSTIGTAAGSGMNGVYQTAAENAPVLVSGVCEYPPKALSSNSTIVSNADYGNGLYTLSASSDNGPNSIYMLFDKSIVPANGWYSGGFYNSTTGSYIGTSGTLTVDGTSYLGEWVTISCPQPIKVSSYTITPRQDGAIASSQRSPKTFWVLASNDSSNWVLLDSQSNLSWNTDKKTFNVSTNSLYKTFRVVCNANGGTASFVSFTEWILYGSDTSDNKGYLSFVSSKSHHLLGDTTSLNISTNGGFTALAKVRFNSASRNDRLIDFGNADKITGNLNISASSTGTLSLTSYNNVSSGDAVSAVSTWTTRASAADNGWHAIVWASELRIFVAIAYNGTGGFVMTSPDGITWTSRAAAINNGWLGLAWAPELGLFAAVAFTGTGNRVMTSPDGITWTSRTSAADNDWRALTWSPELRLFVAVSSTGNGNRVMTSPDGLNWTTRASAADNNWFAVTWAPQLRLFVAVSNTGSGNRVMSSPDGITWTTRASASDNTWRGLVWSPQLSLFVAVADSGVNGTLVMTSSNGITWTTRVSAADNQWLSVTWAPELSLFVAVGFTGAGNRVMTSPDGITWTTRVSAVDNQYRSVAWTPELGIFAAVADSGTGNRVMTSTNVYKGINLSSATSVVNRGEWAVLGARYNSSTNNIQLYKNGVSIASGTSSAALANRTCGNVFIGRANNLYNAYTNMDLSSLYFFDRYLGDAEFGLLNDYISKGSAKASLTSTPTTVTGRYIKLKKSGNSNAITAPEIEVLDNSGSNVAYNKNIVNRNTLAAFTSGTIGSTLSARNYNVIQNGLIAHFDPNDPACYIGSGATMSSLVGSVTGTLNGSYSFNSGTIRLNNTSGTAASNTSRLQLSSLSNVTTVSMWYYQNSTSGSTRYLLDGQTGGAGAFLYNSVAGSNFTTGTLYKNAGSAQSTAWANIETVGSWQNVTVIANTSFTDDMTIFSTYTNNNGLDVTFGPILLYNRVLTAAENEFNYNAILNNYFANATVNEPAFSHLSKRSVAYPPLPLSANSTTIAGESYGNGAYSVSISSTSAGAAWNVFDGSAGTIVTTGTGVYNSSTGSYSGAVSTSDILGNSFTGEYLQIALPERIYATGISISPNTTTFATSAPTNFSLLGSANNIDWNPLITNVTTGWSSFAGQTFNVGGTTGSVVAYDNYRLIANSIPAASLTYPPAAMTADTTNITGASYGNGSYVASMSSVYTSGEIVQAYDKSGTQSRTQYYYDIEGNYLGNTDMPSGNMTSGSITIPSGSVGTGTYVISASSDNGTDFSYYACDGDINTVWTSASNYDATTGSYIGSTLTNGTVAGEWIQVQLPTSITIRRMRLTFHQSNFSSTAPTTVRIALSDTGVDGSWGIENPVTIPSPGTNTVTINSTSGVVRRYWRLIITQVGTSTNGSGQDKVQLSEFRVRCLDTNTSTTDTATTVHTGEWYQLNIPQPIVMKSLNITAESALSRAPSLFALLGSTDGTNWDLLYDAPSAVSWTQSTTPVSFPLSTTNAYSRYRLVAKKTNTVVASLAELSYTRANDTALSLADVQLLGGTTFGPNKHLAFPPAAMTAGTTTITGQGYGNGTYIASANSNFSGFDPFSAFNNTISDSWTNLSTTAYNTTTGSYTGSTSMTAGNIGYAGEWLQLQTPNNILLDSFSLIARQDSNLWIHRAPRAFYIFGSTDGSTWELISSHNTTTFAPNGKYYVANSTKAYNYFRILTNSVGYSGVYDQNHNMVNIAEWKLYGQEVTTPATVTNPYAQIDLGADTPISSVVLYNDITSTSNAAAISSGSLSIINSSGIEVYTKSITGTNSLYKLLDTSAPASLSATRTNVSQIFNAHNDCTLAFDAAYNGVWEITSSSVPFGFNKSADALKLNIGSGSTSGSNLTWSPAISINNSGGIALGNAGSVFSGMYEGIATIGTGNAGINTATVSIGNTLANSNYRVILRAESTNNTIVECTVTNKTTSTFDIKLLEATQGGSWATSLNVNWTVLF